MTSHPVLAFLEPPLKGEKGRNRLFVKLGAISHRRTRAVRCGFGRTDVRSLRQRQPALWDADSVDRHRPARRRRHRTPAAAVAASSCLETRTTSSLVGFVATSSSEEVVRFGRVYLRKAGYVFIGVSRLVCQQQHYAETTATDFHKNSTEMSPR